MKLQNMTSSEVSISVAGLGQSRCIAPNEILEVAETDAVLNSYSSGYLRRMLDAGVLKVVELPRVVIKDTPGSNASQLDIIESSGVGSGSGDSAYWLALNSTFKVDALTYSTNEGGKGFWADTYNDVAGIDESLSTNWERTSATRIRVARNYTMNPRKEAEDFETVYGDWEEEEDPRHSGGIALKTAVNDSYIETTFSGQLLKLVVPKGPSRASVQVSVDGTDYGKIDCNSDIETFQNIVISTDRLLLGSPEITHTVRLTAKDCFQGEIEVPAGKHGYVFAEEQGSEVATDTGTPGGLNGSILNAGTRVPFGHGSGCLVRGSVKIPTITMPSGGSTELISGSYPTASETITHKYRVYSWYRINGKKVFSTVYQEFEKVVEAPSEAYGIGVTWENVYANGEVDGSGFRVLKYHDVDGTPTWDFDHYKDVYTNYLEDTGVDIWTEGNTVRPNCIGYGDERAYEMWVVPGFSQMLNSGDHVNLLSYGVSGEPGAQSFIFGLEKIDGPFYKFAWNNSETSWDWLTVDYALEIGKLYHIVVDMTPTGEGPGRLDVYINGELKGTWSGEGASHPWHWRNIDKEATSVQFFIGGYGGVDSSDAAPYALSEVRIYDRPLTEEEIIARYEDGTEPSGLSILGYWKMNDWGVGGLTGYIQDYSVSGALRGKIENQEEGPFVLKDGLLCFSKVVDDEGVNTQIVIPNNEIFNSRDVVSISFWVKPSWVWSIEKPGQWNIGIQPDFEENGQFVIGDEVGESFHTVVPDVEYIQSFNHIVFQFKADKNTGFLKCYVNGVLVANKPNSEWTGYTALPEATESNLVISVGAPYHSTQAIRQVKFFDRLLTLAEIQALYTEESVEADQRTCIDAIDTGKRPRVALVVSNKTVDLKGEEFLHVGFYRKEFAGIENYPGSVSYWVVEPDGETKIVDVEHEKFTKVGDQPRTTGVRLAYEVTESAEVDDVGVVLK